MNQINYEREMQKILNDVRSSGDKPKLLLHACCAPCASSVVERLKEFFDITLYFYNPNMDGKEEYSLRANEIKRLAEYFGVNYLITEYKNCEFLDLVKGLETEKEGGARCLKCFNLRLSETAEYAKVNGFDFFATTLTLSPLKNADNLNKIGEFIAEKSGVKYLPSDFKKKNGYIRSIELSKALNLYRQNYCGCIFSKAQIKL